MNATATVAPRLNAHLHDLLIVLLVAIRPLAWDDTPAASMALAWQWLVVAAWGVLAIEFATGQRTQWRWSGVGLGFVALVAALIPAALRSPQYGEGLADWGWLAMHLAYAAYLVQAVRGRERLLLGALIGGLAVEALYALGQRVWSLPALGEQIAAGTVGVGFDDRVHADLVDRVARGGVFGTFTLSNQFAGYLLLAIPIAAAAVLRGRPAIRATAAVVGILALLALCFTGSKGAYLSLALVVGVVATPLLRGWWRIAPALLLGMAVLGALAVPPVRDALAASAEVRLGYWRAGAALVAEQPVSGHGLGAYAVEAPRVLAADAEYSKHAHCEPLEVAVEGGVLAGGLVFALLAWLSLRPQAPLVVEPARTSLAPWAIALALPYLQLLGLPLDFTGWPGGNVLFGLPWTLVLGVILAAVAWVCQHAELPPAWALRLALGALAVHSLLDFDLHAGGVLGTLIAVACLANARSRELRLPAGVRIALPLAVVAVAITLGFATSRASQYASLRTLVEQATIARVAVDARKPDRDQSLAALASVIPQSWEESQAGDPAAVRRLLVAARERALDLLQREPLPGRDLAGDTVALYPTSASRLALSSWLVENYPHSARAHGLLAEDHLTAGSWVDAIAAQRRAVALSPWYLPDRQRLARLLERAASAIDDPQLLIEAQAIDREVAELHDHVHFRNRSRR